MIWFSAFILGLMGSFHCIGMCGPIAMAIPGGNSNTKAMNLLLYNSGRIITYSIIGLTFGIIGKGIFIAGFQQTLSIVVGVLILGYLIINHLSGKNKFEKITFVHLFIKKSLARLFNIKSRGSAFGIGMLNGFLPCGLVYVAIAGAIAMAEPIYGALYMSLFGLGTVPVMAGMNIVKNKISVSIRTKIRKLIPYAVAVMALLFIVRGLNLGIPYLSPKIEQDQTELKCH